MKIGKEEFIAIRKLLETPHIEKKSMSVYKKLDLGLKC